MPRTPPIVTLLAAILVLFLPPAIPADADQSTVAAAVAPLPAVNSSDDWFGLVQGIQTPDLAFQAGARWDRVIFPWSLIQKDSQKQIVLYWFKQRDRILSNEYLVKVYLFWDALSRGRTDGALVRIASLVGPGETEDIVDQRLLRFVSTIEPELARYVPD